MTLVDTRLGDEGSWQLGDPQWSQGGRTGTWNWPWQTTHFVDDPYRLWATGTYRVGQGGPTPIQSGEVNVTVKNGSYVKYQGTPETATYATIVSPTGTVHRGSLFTHVTQHKITWHREASCGGPHIKHWNIKHTHGYGGDELRTCYNPWRPFTIPAQVGDFSIGDQVWSDSPVLAQVNGTYVAAAETWSWSEPQQTGNVKVAQQYQQWQVTD